MDPNQTLYNCAKAPTLRAWNNMFAHYVRWRQLGGFRASNAALDAAEDRRTALVAA